MTIKAEIVADSINPTGNRLTTWLLRYPRCIHSELMTHRAFSRNSASSRAIPIETMIQRVLDDPFIPKWSAAHKGMTVTDEIDPSLHRKAELQWLHARDEMVRRIMGYTESGFGTIRHGAHVGGLIDLGLAKSVVNRLLEPWMHIEVVLSATEWNNWFLLRDDPAAEPHIRELAHMMKELHATNEPIWREPTPAFCAGAGFLDDVPNIVSAITCDSWGRESWHLPFLNNARDGRPLFEGIKESVAHAAWVSYGDAVGKEGFTTEDVDRVYTALVGSSPIHASPTEHVAVACSGPHRHGNFTGWCQWRKFLPGESGGDYVG